MGYQWLDVGLFFWADIATFLNFMAACIAFKSKRCHLGFYRYLTVGFCLFNGSYAMILYFTRPVTYIYDHTWLIFPHPYPEMSTLAALRSTLSFLTPYVYVIFDYLWISYFALLYYNRFILVCRPTASHLLKKEGTGRGTHASCVLGWLMVICGVPAMLIVHAPVHQNFIQAAEAHYNITGVDFASAMGISLKLGPTALQSGIPARGILAILFQIVMYLVLPLGLFQIALYTQLKVDRMSPMRYREQKIHQDVLTVIMRMSAFPMALSVLPNWIYMTITVAGCELPLAEFNCLITLAKAAALTIMPVCLICWSRQYSREVKNFFKMWINSSEPVQIVTVESLADSMQTNENAATLDKSFLGVLKRVFFFRVNPHQSYIVNA